MVGGSIIVYIVDGWHDSPLAGTLVVSLDFDPCGSGTVEVSTPSCRYAILCIGEMILI